jgi:hypothetical protein
MQHRAATDFWQQYHALSPEVRARADKQFSLLKQIRSILHYNSRKWESATARKYGPPASR